MHSLPKYFRIQNNLKISFQNDLLSQYFQIDFILFLDEVLQRNFIRAKGEPN